MRKKVRVLTALWCFILEFPKPTGISRPEKESGAGNGMKAEA